MPPEDNPTPERCRLYLISPPAFELEPFAGELEAALAGGDVACFQLRMKDAPDADILAVGRRLTEICHAHDVAFLMNDRPDLALELGADGVHLGQSDMGVREAREILGYDATIGVTCHDSRHLAFEAGEAGADYVAFGAFFPTMTKETRYHPDPEILTWWSEVAELPSVAIGGITVDNCASLAAAGADFVAVSSGVWNYPEGPGEAVRKFNEFLEKASKR